MAIDFENQPVAARVLTAILALASVACAVYAVSAAREVDPFGDAGPPLGAIFLAMPAFALFVGAGVVGSQSFRKRRR